MLRISALRLTVGFQLGLLALTVVVILSGCAPAAGWREHMTAEPIKPRSLTEICKQVDCKYHGPKRQEKKRKRR